MPIASFCERLPNVISKWAVLSDGLLWFLWLEFKTMSQLIVLEAVGVVK